jgi:ABC-type protease/lipase transport system fused ATPase/permease subunit
VDDPVSPLTSGQRKRVALARSLYKKPVFVVLDEPNSNLDAEGDNALSNAILQIRNAGSIVVVMGHMPSAIAAVAKGSCCARAAWSSSAQRTKFFAKSLVSHEVRMSFQTRADRPRVDYRRLAFVGLVSTVVLVGGSIVRAALAQISSTVIA